MMFDIPKELITAFHDNKLIPICGAGLSQNINNEELKPPSWKGLVEHLCDEENSGIELGKIEILKEAKDYVSALTLIKRNTPGFNNKIEQLIKDTTEGLRPGDLLVHMNFWNIGWKVVLTTNYDKLLETAIYDRVLVETYESPNLIQDINRIINSEFGESTVSHLHGLISQSRLLITWEDYFYAYGVNWEIIDSLESFLSDTVPESIRGNYKEILSEILSDAFKIHSNQKSSISTRLPALVDRLLADYSLLLIGFSFTDPLWCFLQRKVMAESGGQPPGFHYILTDSKYKKLSIPGAFKLIDIKSYDNMDKFFLQLADDLGNKYSLDSSLERENRIKNYKELNQRYPKYSHGRHPQWLYKFRQKIVPFVELWANVDNLSPDDAIILDFPSSKQYAIDESLKKVREDYWIYKEEMQLKKRTAEPLTNEIKIRVNKSQSVGNKLYLELEPVEYKDYVVTNHLVANLGEIQLEGIKRINEKLAILLRTSFDVNGLFDPRAFLCASEDSIRLSPYSKCSNHLGVSAILLANFTTPSNKIVPILICPPSGQQISSPNDIIPTVSGSADWPALPEAVHFNEVYSLEQIREEPTLLQLNREVRKELVEECLSDRVNEKLPLGRSRQLVLEEADRIQDDLIKQQVLINFCQNIERGGKPELFYLITIEKSAKEFLLHDFKPNWELHYMWNWIIDRKEIFDYKKRPWVRRILLFPSPLDSDLELSDDWKLASWYLSKVIQETAFNPVLRAHLVSILRLCEIRFPKVSNYLRELNLSHAL